MEADFKLSFYIYIYIYISVYGRNGVFNWIVSLKGENFRGILSWLAWNAFVYYLWQEINTERLAKMQGMRKH